MKVMKKKSFLKSRFIALCAKIKWNEDGLLPCLVQDEKDRTLLMMGYMNRQSLEKTLRAGRCCFWSRSRKKLWLKGEESGNFQLVKKMFLDCDRDALLVLAKQVGGAACHMGMRSCFHQQLNSSGGLAVVGKRMFDPKKVYSWKKG